MTNQKLKVLFVFNRNYWSTVLFKLEQIKSFFLPKVELLIDIKHTNFVDIPFETVETLNGTGSQDGTDVAGRAETVQDEWLDKNIVIPMATGYDIVVFCISQGDKQNHITSSGIRGDRDNGAVECVIFGGDEFWDNYVNGVSLGNNFVVISCHEISHAIYMILALSDNTHKYFYSGYPEKVLEDFVFPLPRIAEKKRIIEILLGLYRRLLTLIIKQKEMPKEIIEEKVENKNKVDLFCEAIQKYEGYFEPNDEYPKGSRSWRNNSPGNLKYAKQTGSTGRDIGGFAIFKDYQAGWKALRHQIEIVCFGQSRVYSPNATVLQFFQRYAPSLDENNPKSYAEFVAQEVGILVSTKMKDLLL